MITMRMASCASALLMALWHVMPAAAAGADGTKAEAPDAKASAPEDKASAPVLTLRSLRVVTGVVVADGEAGTGLQPGRPASQPVGLGTEPAPNTPAGRDKTLVSAGGDLEVVLDRANYEQAVAWRRSGRGDTELALFLNGVKVTPEAKLYAEDRIGDGSRVALRWRLASGPLTQTFWSAVYREHRFERVSDLNVALGWPSTGPNSVLGPGVQALKVAVAPDARPAIALFALLALAVLMWQLVASTDVFRDTLPEWLAIARRWRREYADADAAGKAVLLQTIDPQYNAQTSAQAAQRLLHGEPIQAPGAPGEPSDAAVAAGLLVQGALPDAPFSLSRLQLGLWFAFVVASGLFLWIVYGELPAIAGSALALLGISVGTAGASIAANPDASSTATNISRGLLVDVVTGFDQAHQVHRYQAVVVNLLLLAVGVQHVVAELAFPTFDNTWLAFLGVSGAALAAGKKIVETK